MKTYLSQIEAWSSWREGLASSCKLPEAVSLLVRGGECIFARLCVPSSCFQVAFDIGNTDYVIQIWHILMPINHATTFYTGEVPPER
jgi:hypothetical protein